jgi:hypothetical protein
VQLFVIDAIEVYGALNTLGSLYDDAVTDPDGNLDSDLRTFAQYMDSRSRQPRPCLSQPDLPLYGCCRCERELRS